MLPKKREQQLAVKMRLNGESVANIAKVLKASKSSVCLWTKDVQLTDEQKVKLYGEGKGRYLALRKNAQKAGDKIRAKWIEIRRQQHEQGKLDAQKADHSHMQGCMLYWAEGGKNSNSVRLANTDGFLLKHFVNFLRHFFKVENEKIKIIVRAHKGNGKTLDEIKAYWLKLLELQPSNLTSIAFHCNKPKAKVKKNRHVFGSCEVLVYKAEIVQRIFGAIQEYAGFSNPKWLQRKVG